MLIYIYIFHKNCIYVYISVKGCLKCLFEVILFILVLTHRSTLEQYSLELKRVSQCLFEVISKNLGLKPEALLEEVDDYQGIRMHYYPPCSQASKVLGLNPHSDVGVLTLLHQVGDVQGLQIKRNGKWLPVEPIPHAFVINISDVLEVIN